MQRKRVKLWVGLLCFCLLMGSVRVSAWADATTKMQDGGNTYSDEQVASGWSYGYPWSYPHDNEMLVNGEISFKGNMDAWDNNDNYKKITITDINLIDVYTWDEEGKEESISNEDTDNWISTEYDETEKQWKIKGHKCCYAKVQLSFSVDEEAKVSTQDLEIYVSDSYYRLDIEYEDGTCSMLPNSEKKVSTILTHRYIDEWGNPCEEQVSGYELSILSDEEYNYDKMLLTAEISANKETEIKSNSSQKTGSTNVWFRATYTTNDDEITEDGYTYIDVCKGYHNIEPVQLLDSNENRVNPLVGEELDINTLGEKPCVYYYYIDGDGANKRESATLSTEEIEGSIKLEMEYDTSIFEEVVDTEKSTSEGESFPRLKRISNENGWIKFKAMGYNPEKREWENWTERDYWFDYLDYDTGLDNTSNYNADCVFSDATAEFTLDKSNLADKGDNYNISFDLGTYDENNDTFTSFRLNNSTDEDEEKYFTYVYDEDNANNVTGIVLNGKKIKDLKNSLRDDNRFDIRVQVIVDDIVVSDVCHGIELKESEYNYDYPCSFPCDNMMLKGEDIWINNSMSVWYQDAKHPDGAEEEVVITELTVVTQGTWADNDEETTEVEEDFVAIDCNSSDENGWNLHGEDHGFGRVTITYESVQPNKKKETYEFQVYSVGSYYRLDTYYPNDNNNMLINSEITLETTLVHRYLDEDECSQEEEVKDYKLVLNHDDGKEENKHYDMGLFNVTVGENQKSLIVKSNENQWNSDIWFHAKFTNSDENEDSVGTYANINVCEEFYNIEPVELLNSDEERMNLNLGEEFNILTSNKIEEVRSIYRYYKEDGEEKKEAVSIDSETESTNSYRFSMEFDMNVFSFTTDVQKRDKKEYYPVAELIRKSVDGGNITLIAEYYDKGDECWYELTRRDYWFDYLDLDTWFSNLRDDHYSWVYNDEEFTVELNTENLKNQPLYNSENSPYGYSMEWRLYPYTYAADGNAAKDEGKPYTNDKLMSISDNGKKVTLSGKELYELFEEDAEYKDVCLCYKVYAGEGDSRRAVASDEVMINLREPYYQYFYSYESTEEEPNILLPGESIILDRIAMGYQENKDAPWGDVEDIPIENIKVVDGGENVSLTAKGERGWQVEAKATGTAKIVVEHARRESDQAEEKVCHEVWICVTEDEVGELQFTSSNELYCIRQGEAIDFAAKYVSKQYVDGVIKETEREDIHYEWFLEVVDSEDNIEDYIVGSNISNDTRKYRVTAKEETDGDISIRVTVTVKKDGETLDSVRRTVYIYGNEYEYYEITMDEVAVLAPGDTLDLPIKVIHYTNEKPEGEEVKNPNITLDLIDENMFTVDGTKATIKATNLTESDPIQAEDFRVAFTGKYADDSEYYQERMLSIKICNHKFQETSRTEPTCEKDGVSHQACTKCKKIKDVTIPATGHKEVTDPAVDPTCTDSGLTAGSHCEVCKKTLVKQQTVKALGHDPVKENGVAATCENTGKTEKSTCKRCHSVLTAEQTLAALGHKTETVITAATATAEGSIVERCTACGKEINKTVIASPKTVKLSKDGILTYNKKNQRASVIAVCDTAGNVIPAANYKVSYPDKSKDIGRYAVTITFKGNYSGTLTATYDIAPKGTSLKSVAAGSKRFTAKWKKLTTNTTGYMIQYSTDKNFTKGVKTVTVKKNKTTAATMKKLSAKKKYYVRICTYRNVKYNKKTVKVCSAWSKAKSVKTKK